MSGKRLLTVSQAADYLGISRPTFYRRLEDGTIPFVQLGPRRYIPADVLEKILATLSVPTFYQGEK